jgi:TatD DNase family protein
VADFPGWFDTHAHLCDAKFDSDRTEALDRSFSNGVAALIEIADGPEDWPKARALSARHPGRVWWAAGIHPAYADRASETVWRELRALAHSDGFVAIGEVGLDYFRSAVPADIQKQTFRLAIELAVQERAPLIIHCRNAFDDLIAILRDYFPLREGPPDGESSPGVIHCFSGSEAQGRDLIARGFYLGVDGPLTYPNSKPLRAAVASLPIERLVIETDSPYLPPQGHRGERNEPARLPIIGLELATLKAIPAETAARILWKNGFDLFRL